VHFPVLLFDITPVHFAAILILHLLKPANGLLLFRGISLSDRISRVNDSECCAFHIPKHPRCPHPLALQLYFRRLDIFHFFM